MDIISDEGVCMDAREQEREDRTVSRNKKTRHEYFILESMETGIVLSGTEIKSVRAGHVNLKKR